MLSDRARFRSDDPDPLVAASFACPFCLMSAEHRMMRVWDEERRVFCRCARCNARWSVGVTAEQWARLADAAV
jgi:DNA-directed RNA polymerase subunit M/transcription elongation factor TFIIS